MSRVSWTRGTYVSFAVIVGLAVLALLIGVAKAVNPDGTTPTTEYTEYTTTTWPSATSTTASITTSTTVAITVVPKPSAVEVTKEVLRRSGFTEDMYVIGPERFDLTLPAAKDAASGSFATTPVVSYQELESFLNSGTVAAEKVIAELMKSSGATREEVLNLTNHVGVQFRVPVDWRGNTFFKDGEVKLAPSTRRSGAGDIGWYFVPPSPKPGQPANVVERVVILRGPCGNKQTTPPVPVPGVPPVKLRPPAPPTTAPPTITTRPPTTVITRPPTVTTKPRVTTTLAPKDGTKIPAPPPTTPPRTTPPTTAQPTTPTTGGDSGPGAVTTVPTPTTNPPAPAPSTTLTRTATTIAF